MSSPRPLRLASETGFALVFTLAITGILVVLAATLATMSRLSTMVENGHSDTLRSFYAAEAGVNRGNAEIKNIFLDFNVPNGTDLMERDIQVGNHDVSYTLRKVSGPIGRRIPSGQRYAGLNTIDYVYANLSQAKGRDGSKAAELGSLSLYHSIPIFQFIAFYSAPEPANPTADDIAKSDLEILPGPPMHLHGRIHTNGNLYLNADDSLQITDDAIDANPRLITTVEVTARANIYRGRKDRVSCDGTVSIDTLAPVPPGQDLQPMDLVCNGGVPYDRVAVAPWLGSLVPEVDPLTVPTLAALDRGSTDIGAFWPKADLRVVLDLNPARRINLAQELGRPHQGPDLYRIEVENADQTVDIAKTLKLWQFMNDQPGNLFYNDVPDTNPDPNLVMVPTNCGGICAGQPDAYDPPFRKVSNDHVDPDMVYRPANDGRWSGQDAMDYRRGGFFYNREKRGGEGTFYYLLNLNAQALLTWNLTPGQGNGALFDPSDRSQGGLVIFLSVKNSAVNGGVPPRPSNYGVRVFGSPELPFPAAVFGSGDKTGLTVTSDQAIFVEGNYNCNDKNHCNEPRVTDTWNPAAFLGDSLGILSENWETDVQKDIDGSGVKTFRNDQKTLIPLNYRPAVDTEINAAFIAGVDTTVPGNYNGGFENYPRFQEDWSPDGTIWPGLPGQYALNYRGSFVSLGNPRFVNGPWCGTGGSCNVATQTCAGGTSGANDGHCNAYDPPARNWDYDARFEDMANLPPLTPQVVFAQQTLFHEQFN